MQKIYILAVILLAMTAPKQAQAQCPSTPLTEFEENFEGYTPSLSPPTCWPVLGSGGMFGVQDVTQPVGPIVPEDAHSPNKFFMIYSGGNANTTHYLVTPEISTIDGKHFAEFWLKTFTTATVQAGTMSSNSDFSSFTAIGSPINLTTTYAKYTTEVIPSQAGHKYFAFKISMATAHSVVYFDDFAWKKDTSSDVKQAKEENRFNYYIDANNLTIDAKETIKNVVIYNINGQKVYQSKENNNNVNININNLPKGIYVVKTLIGDKSKTFKFIR